MKRQITLDEYDSHNGNLKVIFSFGDEKYIQDVIDENTFKDFIQKSGRLEYFEDCWDGYTESHYTKDYVIEYYDWKKDYCDNDDIEDFLYYYYEDNKIPDYLK
jgi:hypothetical protein